jgi:hypothetical protein
MLGDEGTSVSGSAMSDISRTLSSEPAVLVPQCAISRLIDKNFEGHRNHEAHLGCNWRHGGTLTSRCLNRISIVEMH